MTTPEDPRVEAAAKAAYERHYAHTDIWPWGATFERTQDGWREYARIALAAADSLDPLRAALRGDLPAPTDDQIERLTTERDEANDRASEWAGKYSQAMTLRDVATKRAEAAELRLDTERAEWDRRALVAAAVGGDQPTGEQFDTGPYRALSAFASPEDVQALCDVIDRLQGRGGDLPKPDERGFSMWFDREQWGAIIDGLIAEREISRKRRAVNSESTSDVRADMCAALISQISRHAMRIAVGGDQPGVTQIARPGTRFDGSLLDYLRSQGLTAEREAEIMGQLKVDFDAIAAAERRAGFAGKVGGDLVQPDVNQRVPDSSQAAGTSIGGDQPDAAAEIERLKAKVAALMLINRQLGDLPKPDEATKPEKIPASRDDWMSREFDRAAKRQAAVPPHARPVITRPSSGVLPEQPPPDADPQILDPELIARMRRTTARELPPDLHPTFEAEEADYPPGSIVLGQRGQYWINTGDGWIEADYVYTEYGVKTWEYITEPGTPDPIWPPVASLGVPEAPKEEN